MIIEIYDYMNSLKKQLKAYQLLEAKKIQRSITFNQKVGKMFHD